MRYKTKPDWKCWINGRYYDFKLSCFWWSCLPKIFWYYQMNPQWFYVYVWCCWKRRSTIIDSVLGSACFTPSTISSTVASGVLGFDTKLYTDCYYILLYVSGMYQEYIFFSSLVCIGCFCSRLISICVRHRYLAIFRVSMQHRKWAYIWREGI